MKMQQIHTWSKFAQVVEKHVGMGTSSPLVLSSWGWRPWRRLRTLLVGSVRPVHVYVGGSQFDLTDYCNVKFYLKFHLHSKLLIDGDFVMTGSFNVANSTGWGNHAVTFRDAGVARRLVLNLKSRTDEKVEREDDEWLSVINS